MTAVLTRTLEAEMRLIAGSGRSGTTWIQDSLAAANQLRPVFEPLNPRASPIGDLYAHRALSATDPHPDLKRHFEEVCFGRRHRLWTQFRRQRDWLFPPPASRMTIAGAAELWHVWRKFLAEVPRLALTSSMKREPLVKCIWSSLMLGWLSRHLNCAIVLVVRHPGAVIESELRSKWSPTFAVNRFREDPEFDVLTNGRYRKLLNRVLSPVEGLAARWVIENQVAIESAREYGLTVVHYEQLKSSPAATWEKIRRTFDLPNVPDAEALARPSQQAAPHGSDSGAGAMARPRWQSELRREQMDQIQGILDEAEFLLYSMSDLDPLVTSAIAVPAAAGNVR